MFKGAFSLFLFGVSLGFGPCVASCGPLLISYVAGTKRNVPQSLQAYGLFSLGRGVAYITLCVIVFALGQLALHQLARVTSLLRIAAALFIIFMGVLLILGKGLNLSSCHALKNHFIEKDKKSILIFGFLTGLMPCAPLFA